MTARNPLWIMNGGSGVVTAEDARLGLVSTWFPPDATGGVKARSGVVPGPGPDSLRVHQTGTPSANLLVEAGQATIQGTTSAAQGVYVATNDAQATLSYLGVYPADAQPRKDIVVARIKDNAYDAGGVNAVTIEIIKGTASGSPVDPTLPASCVPLARINLPASASTVADAIIDDLRVWSVARGGVLPCLSTARPGAPFDGMLIYEQDTDRLLAWDGSKWGTPNRAFTAASDVVTATSAATSGTTALVLSSLSLTIPHAMTLEVDFGWYSITPSNSGDRFDIKIVQAGTQIGARTIQTNGTSPQGGSNVRALAAVSAGAVNINAQIVRVSGSGTATVFGAATAPMLLTAKQFL